jgi:dTDP-L-rhamnose 4-epimerase
MAAPYGIESVCLRLFNVYGPGQALSNPYTGVLAIFASRLLNGQQPMIFEDGEQRRDFVHVGDVARAFADALVLPEARPDLQHRLGRGPIGRPRSRRRSPARWARTIEPEIVGKARIGDIRHCFCDTGLAADKLGFRARQDFEEGLAELAEWVAQQTARGSRRQAAPNSKRGGWWHEARERPADPCHRRRRLHRLQSGRSAGRRRAMT